MVHGSPLRQACFPRSAPNLVALRLDEVFIKIKGEDPLPVAGGQPERDCSGHSGHVPA
jgi:hypothetical protein